MAAFGLSSAISLLAIGYATRKHLGMWLESAMTALEIKIACLPLVRIMQHGYWYMSLEIQTLGS